MKHPTDGEDQAVTLERVPLGVIIANDELQVRHKLDLGTVDRYCKAMNAGASFPPPLVARVGGTEALLLIDGFHRLHAMRNAFRPPDELEVELVAVRTMAEARWLAAKANLRHGLQLKKSELRDAFRAYVRAKEHRDRRTGALRTYRDIAADLERPVSTIHRWMEKDFPRVFRQMGGFGSENAKGGFHELPAETPEEAMARQLAETLTEAAMAIPAMKPQTRTCIRSAAARIVDSIDTANLLEGVREEAETPF